MRPSLNNIETLLLDMDGTVLDLHFDNHFWVEHLPRRYGQIHQLAERQAAEYVAASLEAAHGSLDWYCIDHWARHFSIDIMELKREIDHLIRYRDGSLEFLRRLEELDHLHVLVITDAHPDVLVLKQELTGLLDHVDGWFSSHHFGKPKRDPAFWQALSAEISFDPERTMMIDDNVSVLDAARDFGIRHAVCINQPDSARTRNLRHDYLRLDSLSQLLNAA